MTQASCADSPPSETVCVDGMPDYVRRISDCIAGADVGGLTMDWARVLFDLKELYRQRRTNTSNSEPAK